MKKVDLDIDHKIVAIHNGKSKEAMRQLKKRYIDTKNGLWEIYVKAYFFDISKTEEVEKIELNSQELLEIKCLLREHREYKKGCE